jgi:hypothetical protein
MSLTIIFFRCCTIFVLQFDLSIILQENLLFDPTVELVKLLAQRMKTPCRAAKVRAVVDTLA